MFVPRATINNWGLIPTPHDVYTAPELIGIQIVGKTEEPWDPRDPENLDIRTSRVMGKCGDLIITRNSAYKLGIVDPAYEAVAPDARDRLFNSLKEISFEP